MNRREHLLVCLAEECDEVGQRVAKALRFGLSEKQVGQDLTNAQRIVEELRDLIAVAVVLRDEEAIPAFYPEYSTVQMKLAKIEKYMAISRQQGVLS